MNPFWITLMILGGAGFAGALLLVARLSCYRHALHAGRAAEWDGLGFDREKYEPMARLLSEEDAAFLASQPGIDRREIAEFERDRREIFRSYLVELVGDFGSLHQRARELVAAAPAEHGDLVGGLLQQQVAFWSLLARIELQLMLAPLGIKAGDPSRILEVVGSLGSAVARGTQAPGPVAV